MLGVAYGDLTIIEELYPGLFEICCNEMFEKWLQNDTQATWNKIFAAVGIESLNQIPNYKPTSKYQIAFVCVCLCVCVN